MVYSDGPLCPQCNNHIFSVYIGGRKEIQPNLKFCKTCIKFMIVETIYNFKELNNVS